MNPTCAQNLVFQFTVLHMFTEDAILKPRFVTGSSPNSGKTTSSQPWSQTTAPRCCPKLSASPSLSSTASSLPQASSALGHSHTHIHKMNTSLLVISFYVSERENEIFTSGGKQIHILTSEFNYWWLSFVSTGNGHPTAPSLLLFLILLLSSALQQP